MSSEIQLISDGDGLAILGHSTDVDQFLKSEGLSSRDLELPRLSQAMSAGAAATQVGSEIAANSGRWVKLTKESARLVEKHGLRQNSKGLSTGVVKGSGKGQIGGFVEFAKAPGALLKNPAALSGAAGLMAQLAMKQAMDEVTEYLATIDEKLDDVLRAHKNAVLADLIGVHLVIEEAMTIREHGRRVNEITWSKAQATSSTIARSQAYALLQLDSLAEKLERKTKMGDLAEASTEAEAQVREWLAVLARCFQLQDATSLLELDRVLEAAPGDLDDHRLGLRAARQNRLELISRSTDGLLDRIEAAAGLANAKVLLHPAASRSIVESSNHVSGAIVEFQGRLGIRGVRDSVEARRWLDAAIDVKDRMLETGADGVSATRRFGHGTAGRAKSVTGKFSSDLAERSTRWRKNDDSD